jgi:hypothetical protein
VIGTREQKRAARAAPAPLDKTQRFGCSVVLVLAGAICVSLYLGTGYIVWLVIGAPAGALLLVILANEISERALLLRAQSSLGRRGVRCVVVLSPSPVWRDHIATEWMPSLAPFAVTLDWSQRKHWGRTLPAELFDRFCGRERNFNPAVLVLRGWRRPYVFRFYEAFRAAQHGRPQYLRQLETEMLAACMRRAPVPRPPSVES